MATTDYELVLEQADIVEVVGEFVDLTRRGKNYFGLCPFHDENTPSFSVSPEKSIAKCMGCGEGGNTITIYSKLKNITINEAISELANKFNIKITGQRAVADPNQKYYPLLEDAAKFYHQYLFYSKSGQEALDYLKSRRIDDSVAKEYNLGLSPTISNGLYQHLKSKDYSTTDMLDLGLVRQNERGDYYDYFINRLIFPVTNARGQIVGFSSRALSSNDKVKYLNSTDSSVFNKSNLLYNFSNALQSIRRYKSLILTEGFFDVIAAGQADINNIAATMGTALTESHVELIKRYTNNVILAFDGDSAGVKASLASLKLLTNARIDVRVINLPNNKDLFDFINETPKNKIKSSLDNIMTDGYRFAYDTYKADLDINNMNDVNNFKRNFQTIINNQNQTVKSFYEKLFKKDTGLDIKFYSNNFESNSYFESTPYTEPKNIPRNSTIEMIRGRIENAQKMIIIELMVNRTNFININEQIELSSFISDGYPNVFRRILKIYHTDQSLDSISKELMQGDDEITNKLINEEIIKHPNFIKKIKLSNDEIHNYIQIINNSSLYHELKSLFEELNGYNKEEEITSFAEKINNAKILFSI